MTRFARNPEGRKRKHDASTWQELKSGNPSGNENNSESPIKKKKIFTTKDSSAKGPTNFNKKKPFKKHNKAKEDAKKKGDCFNCGKHGHKAMDCPEPFDDWKKKIVCRGCNGVGHKIFQCPNAENKDKQFFKANTDKREFKDAVKKFHRGEKRRVKRQQVKQNQKRCFQCREEGHQLADCPQKKKGMEDGAGICFKCGSTEHSVASCKLKLPAGEFPFAKCFICKETGHLSRTCPDNPRGLYPDGGCCDQCGSVEHLKKDCPDYQAILNDKGFKLAVMGKESSIDSEDFSQDGEGSKAEKPVKKKKPKVVKF